ncbi:MAG TPA: hypothetical protein QF514_05635, partial [Candidatus Thalassarchaeaceae archaeon]|nr:hypothetical protein [Candidatus Thalassarchaeaceae archaeon]
ERSSKMRLSAATTGAKAARKVLETSSKQSARERRRWCDIRMTVFATSFEDDGRTRKRSQR